MIKVCAEAKVRNFSYRNLRLEFHEDRAVSPSLVNPSAPEPMKPAEAALSDQQKEAVEQEALVVEDARTKEDRMALLMIENPLLLEKMIERGELDEAGAISEDGEE